jgi:response regulator RpfG family c-di-GMP phosphodiesterase
MEPGYQHKALVADDDEAVSKTIARVLQHEDIVFVFTDCGDSALEHIKNAKEPFSIIIANQELKVIKGERLLEHAKNLMPESSRFLMGTYSEFGAIIDAVNKDLIQRYIVKPLNDEEFLNTIRYGIKFFESFFENESLLNLAKKQNTQLYELSCNLMEAATGRTKELSDLDREIDFLEKKRLGPSSSRPVGEQFLLDIIEAGIENETGVDSKKAQSLFSGLIKKLYHEFDDLAHQNGFELPAMESETA